MDTSLWIGVGLLAGDLGCMVVCGWLALGGAWFMAPFAAMCGVAAIAVGRELWTDWV